MLLSFFICWLSNLTHQSQTWRKTRQQTRFFVHIHRCNSPPIVHLRCLSDKWVLFTKIAPFLREINWLPICRRTVAMRHCFRTNQPNTIVLAFWATFIKAYVWTFSHCINCIYLSFLPPFISQTFFSPFAQLLKSSYWSPFHKRREGKTFDLCQQLGWNSMEMTAFILFSRLKSGGKRQHLPSTFIYHTFLISSVWVFW